MSDIKEIQKQLLNSIIEADREKALELIFDWAKLYGYHKAYYQVFDPVLNRVGELWYENKLSLAQGYFAGKIAEDVFAVASKDFAYRDNLPQKGAVVIGNIEDDFHSLGRKLLGVFLKLSGWTVYDLGNDISAKEFVDKALETNSKIIGVSAMMFTTAKNIASVRDELNKRNLSGKIQLAVGGAVFRLSPKLIHEVGGDGTAENAIKAPALFDRLFDKTQQYES